MRALQALDVGEEILLVAEPALQRRPGAEQRFMDDLDHGNARSDVRDASSRASISARISRSASRGSAASGAG